MPAEKRAQLYRGWYAMQLAGSLEVAKQTVQEVF